MALSEHYMDDELHPIDMVEHIAAHYAWECDRIGDDQIAMAVEGQWRTYTVTLSWSAGDETLRMICSFEMEPPQDRLPALYEGLNRVNDQCWGGAYSYWPEAKMMIYKYGLILAGGTPPTPTQVDTMIQAAVQSAERYYPAFQLMVWTDRGIDNAMQIAMTEAYGRA